jgi:hypothetical protein
MTDFRALCAELLEAANTLLGQGKSPANPGERLILTVHLENLEDCANRTRAALAEQPVVPTPLPGDAEGLAEVFWGRYAQPEPVAPTPIPVAERLPGAEDLDPNGRCWVYQNEKSTTHWLPANALPVPAND